MYAGVVDQRTDIRVQRPEEMGAYPLGLLFIKIKPVDQIETGGFQYPDFH